MNGIKTILRRETKTSNVVAEAADWNLFKKLELEYVLMYFMIYSSGFGYDSESSINGKGVVYFDVLKLRKENNDSSAVLSIID